MSVCMWVCVYDCAGVHMCPCMCVCLFGLHLDVCAICLLLCKCVCACVRVWREMRHNTLHHIRTIPYPPITCRPRRLAIAKVEFDVMLRKYKAHRSENSWCSALHNVPKKDTIWHPCGEYRALNARRNVSFEHPSHLPWLQGARRGFPTSERTSNLYPELPNSQEHQSAPTISGHAGLL
jgi:hypothetical protein